MTPPRQPPRKPRPRGPALVGLVLLWGLPCIVEWLCCRARDAIADRIFEDDRRPPERDKEAL